MLSGSLEWEYHQSAHANCRAWWTCPKEWQPWAHITSPPHHDKEYAQFWPWHNDPQVSGPEGPLNGSSLTDKKLQGETKPLTVSTYSFPRHFPMLLLPFLELILIGRSIPSKRPRVVLGEWRQCIGNIVSIFECFGALQRCFKYGYHLWRSSKHLRSAPQHSKMLTILLMCQAVGGKVFWVLEHHWQRALVNFADNWGLGWVIISQNPQKGCQGSGACDLLEIAQELIRAQWSHARMLCSACWCSWALCCILLSIVSVT